MSGCLAFGSLAQADVLNRGFGGYNSKWAAYILPSIVSDLAKCGEPPVLAAVFFGANDAASPTSGRWVCMCSVLRLSSHV